MQKCRKNTKNHGMTATSKVLLYDNNFLKNPDKLEMNWLGPFIVVEVWDNDFNNLAQLGQFIKQGWMDETCLDPQLMKCQILNFFTSKVIKSPFHWDGNHFVFLRPQHSWSSSICQNQIRMSTKPFIDLQFSLCQWILVDMGKVAITKA